MTRTDLEREDDPGFSTGKMRDQRWTSLDFLLELLQIELPRTTIIPLASLFYYRRASSVVLLKSASSGSPRFLLLANEVLWSNQGP
jgi:hypothetical protein